MRATFGQRVRFYYECCGRKWSQVFTVGDGKPRTAQCFKCKARLRPVSEYRISE